MNEADFTTSNLKDMVLIDHCPPEVQTRATPGHFEGGLIMGPGNASAVGVLVERTARFMLLCQAIQVEERPGHRFLSYSQHRPLRCPPTM